MRHVEQQQQRRRRGQQREQHLERQQRRRPRELRSLGSMTLRSRNVWAWCSLATTVLLTSIRAQPMAPIIPPADDNCFATLGALNNVMETELTRIRNGATPSPEYLYTLCPNAIYDTTNVVLEPVLNNVIVVCGADGRQSNRCVLLGGTTQVRLVDSLVDGYPLQEVSFMGLTFSGFTTNAQGIGTSIAAMASSATTATFTDCVWQDFTSDFVVQQNATERFLGAMTVQIERSIVRTGQAGAIFDNDGGLLRISDLVVTSVTAASLVATANNGASFLERTTVTASDLNTVTYTTAGGSQTAMTTSVMQMTRLQDAFFVEDAGSTILLQDVTISENQGQVEPWHAVSVRTMAIARISESTIADNTGLEYGIVAFGATVSISDSFLSRNSGLASDETSAAIFAITDATVNVERVEFTENSGFSGLAVALIRSEINIRQSCFQGGSSEYVVFIANDATYDVSENFVDNLESEQCQSTGPRLFQESTGSACFLGSSTCEGTCLVLAEETSCRAQDGPTRAPVTIAPVTAPMALTRRPSVPTRAPRRTRAPIRTRAPKGIVRPTLAPTTRLRPTASPAPTVTAFPTMNPTVLIPSMDQTKKPKPDKSPKGGKGKGGKKSDKDSKSGKKRKKSDKSGKGKGGKGDSFGKSGKGNDSKGGKGGKGKGDYYAVDQSFSPSPVPMPSHQVYPSPMYSSNHQEYNPTRPLSPSPGKGTVIAEPRSPAPTVPNASVTARPVSNSTSAMPSNATILGAFNSSITAGILTAPVLAPSLASNRTSLPPFEFPIFTNRTNSTVPTNSTVSTNSTDPTNSTVSTNGTISTNSTVPTNSTNTSAAAALGVNRTRGLKAWMESATADTIESLPPH